MKKFLRDPDQTENELLDDLFGILEYENNGRLTAHKLSLLAKEKFSININEDQAKEMFQVLGVKRGRQTVTKDVAKAKDLRKLSTLLDFEE